MFLLDLFKKRAKGRTPYEWFEQMILGILVFIIAMIIIYTLILAIITLVNDFRSGITFMETAALQDTFGLILTVIILVEFNHSIVLAIRQRSGAIQVRIVVLITVIVLARKLVSIGLRGCERGDLAGPRRSGALFRRSVLADLRRRAAQAGA